jgi:predicted N-acetyltransferase YhbS
VEENARRRGIGSAMMWKLEIEARVLGQNTLIHEGLEERELFYQRCGYRPNLYIQLPEPGCVENLAALNPGLPVTWKSEGHGKSRLMLRTQQIDKELQEKYNRAFPSCSTQYVFIKRI